MRKNLKDVRKKTGMTQQAVADYLGIDVRNYQKIESGKITGAIVHWDALEDLFEVHQRKLREIQSNYHNQEEKVNVQKIKVKYKQKTTKQEITDSLNKANCGYKEMFEGRLIVTEKGDVYRRWKNGEWKKAKLSSRVNGYLATNMEVGGKRKGYLVHRLVAMAFISNPDNYPVVNHLDGNTRNNIVTNLEWCTTKQNIRHGLARHSERYLTNLKQLRKDQGVSTTKVSRSIGIMLGRYRDIENAVTKPNNEQVKRIERFFGKDIDFLLLPVREE